MLLTVKKKSALVELDVIGCTCTNCGCDENIPPGSSYTGVCRKESLRPMRNDIFAQVGDCFGMYYAGS